MKPGECLRLLLPGMCIGLLPACFTPGTNRSGKQQFTGQYGPPVGAQRGYPMQPPGNVQSPFPIWNRSPQENRTSQYPETIQSPLFGNGLPSSPYAPIPFYPISPIPIRPAQSPVAGDPPANLIQPNEVRTGFLAPHQPDLLEMAASGRRSAEEPNEPAGKMPLADPLSPKVEAPKKLPESILADSPLVAALKCLLEKRPDEIRDKLKSLDPAQREVLMKLLPFTVEVSEGGLASADPHEIAIVVDNLQGLLWALRPRAALVIDKFCFCKRVQKFGRFDPLDNDPSFRPGDMVEVYAEIRNVSSQPHQTKQGDFRTHLRSKLEIRDSAGGVIFSWQRASPTKH